MSLLTETVAIPVVKGVDVTTNARLLPPMMLLEALNSRFPTGSGATKRRGHVATVARSTTPLPPSVSPPSFDPPAAVPLYSTADRGFPADWLFGWGMIVDENRDGTVRRGTSEHPDAGLLFGAATRDQEAVAWNGWQLLSRVPEAAAGGPLPTVESAVMPMLRAEPIAKAADSAQSRPEIADTGRIRVAAWYNSDTDDVEYSVIDSITGAVILPATPLELTGIEQLRVVPVGQWVHILVSSDSLLLARRSVHADSPRDLISASLGACDALFDVCKVSETDWAVLRRDDSEGLHVTWHFANGSLNGDTHDSSEPEFTETAVEFSALALAVHPVTGRFCIAAKLLQGEADTEIWAEVFDADGTSTEGLTVIIDNDYTDGDAGRPLTVVPKYLYSATGNELWDVYYDETAGTSFSLEAARIEATEAAPIATTDRDHLTVASKGFRVGDRTFIWAGYRTTFQTTWLLVDEDLEPVGHCNYTTANIPSSAEQNHLASVNFSGEAPAKDCIVFHLALGYKLRVAAETETVGENTPAVYADPSIEIVTLDFLPPLRSAQAGRAVYFPGAQLWSYDGNELTEAGFHFAPENVTVTLGSSGGGLGVGAYRWRVDLCYRNAQNEEIRSQSFFTAEYSPTSGQKATLALRTVPTRRRGSYFLIYRNEINGVQWYLVSSRDPSSAQFVPNEWDSADDTTFLDDGIDTPTDAELISLEQHPGNGGFNYIPPIAAPACEILAAGHDRLWIAGGEIPAGQVHPSRLFDPGEAPSFNPVLLVQVDRSIEPITAIGFVGETRAFFRRTQTYVHEGDGPDNSRGGGLWMRPRLAYSDVGAIGPEGLGLISAGLLFQSPAGIRLLTPGGGLSMVGHPVDSIAATEDLAGTLVVGADQEIRFYSRSGTTLVYNYQYDTWTTWSVTAAGVARNPDTGLATLANPRGYLWDETDGVWTDAGKQYNHRIRFAWLRQGELMDFQRVRRIGALGTWTQPHHVHVDVYYDEREFAEEWFDWDVPDDGSQNTDAFGDNNFGDGSFGDTQGVD